MTWVDWQSYWQMGLLGLIQGITEFIPVSSSGHLVLGRYLLDVDTGGGALAEIVLHAGSLVSITIYYRHRLWRLTLGGLRGDVQARRDVAQVVLGCIPVTLLYVLAGRWILLLFDRPRFAAAALLVTGGVVFSSRWIRPRDGALTLRRAFWIGVAQAAALLPGISRSGVTIVSARFQGISGERAAEFSFLMAFPLLVGSTLVGIYALAVRGVSTGVMTAGPLFFGFLVSAVVGLGAIDLLVRTLRRRGFFGFGWYAFAVGVGSLLWMGWGI